jgi:hypothetical protein
MASGSAPLKLTLWSMERRRKSTDGDFHRIALEGVGRPHSSEKPMLQTTQRKIK